MMRYHYLGAGPLCGAQLRYLIKDCKQRILGGFAFSAASYSIACRDNWIGWDSNARRENLHRIICNSRFLIIPHVKIPHLASHVLGAISNRIVSDWNNRYGYEPVLMETFVDPQRFKGTSYRAANWIMIGKTTGRSRQDKMNSLQVGEKQIYVYALKKDACKMLCTRTGNIPNIKVPPVIKSTPQDWAEEEFGSVDLGDRRLNKRLLDITRDFWTIPQANIPQACKKRSKIKAAYRFFEHESTSMEAILKPHHQATTERIRKENVVLAVQDTTELNYSTHQMTEGLGPVGTSKDGAIGMFVHDTLAFTPDGTPLGLMNVQCWARDKEQFGKRYQRYDLPIEKKESNKWLVSYRAVKEIQKQCPATQIVSVSDRESDIYELFVEALKEPAGPHVLVRAKHGRVLLEDREDLWDNIKKQKESTQTSVTIPRRGNHPARIANLSVHFAQVTISPPKRKPGLGKITIWAISATEIQAPKGQESVEWLLLTTKPITNVEDSLEALKWYSRRWGIEVYHRTLKSGCKIEERQLGSAEKIESCLAIDMVVAWRIHFLTKMGRETPNVPCTVFFEDYEWKALVTHINKKPLTSEEPPSLRDAVRMVASLGGFMGRKCDGEPGTKTTWLGLQCLDGISVMFKYMAEMYAPHLLKPSVSSGISYG